MEWTFSSEAGVGIHPDATQLHTEHGIDDRWSIAGPYTADRVLLAAEEIDELTRYLAHATLPERAHVAVTCGKDLCRLISALRSGVGRLDQVLVQIRHRAQECVAPPEDAEDEAALLLADLDSAAERIRDAVATMASAHRSAARIQ
ncbi:hypothetical protein [Pseudonocardia parietis]|uniref:Uncharacterized protein n=1 Tax=Pseudonocardia parietis TaxID=570936 RepID=A0ABS4W5Y7_9PSEU|nr:hypothetical protein [Pseudonocardia parietis]MBP2371333.1 hypothetical protein [Pseudonocardia parietis]